MQKTFHFNPQEDPEGRVNHPGLVWSHFRENTFEQVCSALLIIMFASPPRKYFGEAHRHLCRKGVGDDRQTNWSLLPSLKPEQIWESKHGLGEVAAAANIFSLVHHNHSFLGVEFSYGMRGNHWLSLCPAEEDFPWLKESLKDLLIPEEDCFCT